jgi:acetyl-CoA synthetase
MSTPASAVRSESTYPTIVKVQRQLRLCPNLADYDHTCHHFTWDSARLMLEGLPGGRGLNIAHEAVDRHAAGPLANHLAAPSGTSPTPPCAMRPTSSPTS